MFDYTILKGTVHQRDFRYNWKNIQWDIHKIKAYSSELRKVFVCPQSRNAKNKNTIKHFMINGWCLKWRKKPVKIPTLNYADFVNRMN